MADYHFLNQFLPYKHYHGVEHHNSTVIVLGPAEQLMSEGLYKELLGVSCHELFHTWNIKSIRPAEMQPYDYTPRKLFPHLLHCRGHHDLLRRISAGPQPRTHARSSI